MNSSKIDKSKSALYEKLAKELAQVIRQGNVGFFFGAGMSKHSGIPTARTIIDKIVMSLGFAPEQAEKIRELEYPFEVFLELLSIYASPKKMRKMLKIFDLGDPTQFHWLTEKLVGEKFVTQLMTTNFDQLIERTNMDNINVVYHEKYFQNLSSQVVNYIKIHGGSQRKNTIRTVISSIARKKLRTQRKKAMRFFFNEAGLKTIFVFGYSCSDKMDITPCLREIKNSKTNIIFIEHASDNKISTIPKDNPFEGFGISSKCIRCDTDNLIWELSKCFDLSASRTTVQKELDTAHCLDFGDFPYGIRYLFAAKALSSSGYYEDAANILQQALQNEGRNTAWAEIISLLFEVFHNIHTQTKKDICDILPSGASILSLVEDRKAAQAIFAEIPDKKESCNKVGELNLHWGHLLLSLRKYDGAILAYSSAMQRFKKTSNTYRVYQCRNNIANTIFWRWKVNPSSMPQETVYQRCYSEWHSCLRYFSQSQYVFEKEIAYENMAELLLVFKKTQKKRIAHYISEARKLSEYLNDQTGCDNCKKLENKANEIFDS